MFFISYSVSCYDCARELHQDEVPSHRRVWLLRGDVGCFIRWGRGVYITFHCWNLLRSLLRNGGEFHDCLETSRVRNWRVPSEISPTFLPHRHLRRTLYSLTSSFTSIHISKHSYSYAHKFQQIQQWRLFPFRSSLSLSDFDLLKEPFLLSPSPSCNQKHHGRTWTRNTEYRISKFLVMLWPVFFSNQFLAGVSNKDFRIFRDDLLGTILEGPGPRSRATSPPYFFAKVMD